jgi:oligoendopeptidase F
VDMMPDTEVASVAWDLADLYTGPDDPRLTADLEAALAAGGAFAAAYRGQILVSGGPSPQTVAEAVAALEAILERAARPGVYAELLHAADMSPPAHGALVARTQEQLSAVRQQVLFFELEWLALDEESARAIIDHPACRRYRHFLSSLRRYRAHVRSEAEEKVLEEKANTGGRAFARLFDELVASLIFTVEVDGATRELNESEVLALLYDHRRSVRRAAAKAVTHALQTNQLVIGFIFNTLVYDHAIDDRLRAFPHPMASRNLANEIDTESVQALMRACEARHDLVHRYYTLKRRLLGVDALLDYDRYAPLAPETGVTSWPRCHDIVLTAYGAFAPLMRDIAADFFVRRWIDAEVRSGKRGGAFCASTVPAVHPYVLVNYTGKLHDVMTVAHELGHGVHQFLSRRQGYLQAETPLTMAETASVFGEMLVFEHLMHEVREPVTRLRLLCGKIEDTIATVFRQVALTRFEERLHMARRAQGEVARDQICQLWQQTNAALYGDAVTLTDDYRWWWAYIPHFIHTPFYCYAYGFGELLVLALYEIYRREGAAFVPKYLDLLAAGGSDTPANLLHPLGIDVSNPGFWELGLQPIETMVTQAEQLASAVGTALAPAPAD